MRYFFIICFCVLSSILDAACWVKSADEFQALHSIQTEAYAYLKTAESSPQVARFIFVRHGESFSNKEKSMAGRTLDVDLSEKGVEQAKRVGEKLAAIGIFPEETCSSPSLRAKRAAHLIQEQLGKEGMRLDERLYERFYGPYEGASEKEYAPVAQVEKENCKGPHKSFEEKFAFRAHPEIESMQEVHARVLAFLSSSALEKMGSTILVATHNSPLKALFMADAMENGADVDYSAFDLGNGALLIVEMNLEGSIRVVASSGLTYRLFSK